MLNSAPNSWTINNLCDYVQKGEAQAHVGGGWVPARPFGFFSLGSRVRLAWAVFTGRADALFWPGQMPKAY